MSDQQPTIVRCDDYADIEARHTAEGRVMVPITDAARADDTAAKDVTAEDADVVTKPARKPATKKRAAKKA